MSLRGLGPPSFRLMLVRAKALIGCTFQAHMSWRITGTLLGGYSVVHKDPKIKVLRP